jgi:PKD repeat protein
MRLPVDTAPRPLHRPRGQSLVEFALVLPVLLLIMLTAIDFGRVFLGWVNLQQMTRIAANYAAEHASAWGTPGDAAKQATYQQRILNDAEAINCDLPGTIPAPIIAGGTGLGAPVRVGISCQFHIITPIISDILGGTILVSAETTYPIKEGAVATVPGGGAPITVPPVADFTTSPRTGWAPLEVTFTDMSTGGPSGWIWQFNQGPTSTGGATPDVNQSNALDQGPWTITYDCVGDPGDTCTFGVSLQVSNSGGTDTLSRSDWITVTVPPDTGPIAEFTADPVSGLRPLAVDFEFVDLRAGTVNYTDWEWDFGDGSAPGTGETTSHTYTADGSYDVTLLVTDDTGATNELVKLGYINVTHKICRVPDFANTQRNAAQDMWEDAGFTTDVGFLDNGNFTIQYQSLVGGTVDPQPDGCDSVIQVGP